MKTVTGLFDNYSDAKQAVKSLEEAGIATDDISIVTSNANITESHTGEGVGVGAGIGATAGGAGGLLAGLGMLAIPGVGPVVAAGWLAALAAGAAGGAIVGGAAGGIIGALTETGMSEKDAHTYAEGLRRGGTLVTARVHPDQYEAAHIVLERASRVDINKRRSFYEQDGWNEFDTDAKPYSVEDIEAERLRHR